MRKEFFEHFTQEMSPSRMLRLFFWSIAMALVTYGCSPQTLHANYVREVLAEDIAGNGTINDPGIVQMLVVERDAIDPSQRFHGCNSVVANLQENNLDGQELSIVTLFTGAHCYGSDEESLVGISIYGHESIEEGVEVGSLRWGEDNMLLSLLFGNEQIRNLEIEAVPLSAWQPAQEVSWGDGRFQSVSYMNIGVGEPLRVRDVEQLMPVEFGPNEGSITGIGECVGGMSGSPLIRYDPSPHVLRVVGILGGISTTAEDVCFYTPIDYDMPDILAQYLLTLAEKIK